MTIPGSVFNGDLGLPDLKFTWKLADGSFVETPVYHGIVQVVGLKSVPALITVLGDDYVLGRGVIDRFKVSFDHGRKVVVEL